MPRSLSPVPDLSLVGQLLSEWVNPVAAQRQEQQAHSILSLEQLAAVEAAAHQGSLLQPLPGGVDMLGGLGGGLGGAKLPLRAATVQPPPPAAWHVQAEAQPLLPRTVELAELRGCRLLGQLDARFLLALGPQVRTALPRGL
jgi:hypothetical protein